MTDFEGSWAAGADTVSIAEFHEASMLFCDRHALIEQSARAEDEARLFGGKLRTCSMSSGINLSTANIRALRDSDHAVIFPRSLSIVISLEGRPSEVKVGHGAEKIVLKPGEAALFTFSDDEATQGRYYSGDCSRSVLLQLRPGTIGDERLAALVEKMVGASEMFALGSNKRLTALANQLFDENLSGTVGGLLCESYVLELVARALQAVEGQEAPASAAVRPGDRARMERVRRMILDEPGAPHSLHSLAKEAGVSVSGLKTKFRQVFGQPVFAFLYGTRMEMARTGIELEGWSVKQAAHFTGYAHVSNFSTAYQKHFGRSPGRTGQRTIYPSA